MMPRKTPDTPLPTNGRGIHKHGIPILTLEYTKDASFRMAEAEHTRAERMAEENKRLRTELRYRQVIEKYNRAHGQRKKTTLKEICAQEGVSYEAVRKFRLRASKGKKKK